MARRSLSTQGRILAAGVSIAVGSALVGFMAAGDHTADASQDNPSASASSASSGGATATPVDGRSSDDGNGSFPSGGGSFPTGTGSLQPQTRTGGS